MKAFVLVLMTLVNTTFIFSQNSFKVRECVVENGALKEVVADYNRTTGEKTIVINGVTKNLDSVQQKNKEYAGNADWFKKSEVIKLGSAKYEKYGLPRIVGTTEIVKGNVYKGIPVFQEPSVNGTAEVIYIPVRWGCEFQPYQLVLPECGTIKIKATSDSIAVGKSIGLQIETPKDDPKFTYSWSAFGGTVRGPYNERKVAITQQGNYSYVSVDVTISGPGCSSKATKTITVVRK